MRSLRSESSPDVYPSGQVEASETSDAHVAASEGADDVPFDDAQYAVLAALSRALAARYPVDAFAGHSDVAPGRKTDPGPHFDWQRFASDAGFSAEYFPFRQH